jgi:cysteinyl-tRNA synthetase
MRFDAMDLKLYDTLSREKRVFAPLDPANVRMYVCGPTVYDFAHIGNARPVIVFDVLFRLLRHIYGAEHVTYVRNITDVDDKINARAAEEYPGLPLNEAIRQVTEKTDRQFHEDVAALGCLPPTIEPRATEHIAEMKKIISRLIKSKRAYRFKNHVLFRVKGLASYGKLSHRSLGDMRSSARGEVAPKHNPMDFVLWKPSDAGEPSWPSPAGIKIPGRPGWHIECSAMSWKYLGERFDIHGGGVDLLFPHHENERAQSCRAFNKHKMAQVWMHNGFLQVEGEKMSKSLGNFVTIHELLSEWPGEVLRLNMLQTHYREPINWTAARLREVRNELGNWADDSHSVASEEFHDAMVRGARPITPDEAFIDALKDDLNTSGAITRLREIHASAMRGNSSEAEKLLMSLIWIGAYRYEYHAAYLFNHAVGSAQPYLLTKYREVLNRARAIVLNEYKYLQNYDDRLELLKSIESKANAIDPQLRNDGVGIKITEHCDVQLIALDESAKLDRAKIQALIDSRAVARMAKDFAASDRIRDDLAAMGVVLKDTKDGTTWEIAR